MIRSLFYCVRKKIRADRPCDAPESNGRLHEVKDMGDRLYKIGLQQMYANKKERAMQQRRN